MSCPIRSNRGFVSQAFLTGAKQNFARKHKVPIDNVDFSYNVLGETPEGTPEDGVYVYGIFLEGARFSSEHGMLAESEPKVLFTELPMMWLRPQELANLPDTPHYVCPLYKTSDRRGTLSTTGHSTNFVMYLKLPSNLPQTHWVLRGVAGLCQLDD